MFISVALRFVKDFVSSSSEAADSTNKNSQGQLLTVNFLQQYMLNNLNSSIDLDS